MPIEIYYDPEHAYNVDRMIDGTQKSLDYFTGQLRPYQLQPGAHPGVPALREFAQSFPNTIPFSEAIGFIADLRDEPKDIDYVYYVTAHEIGAPVVGAPGHRRRRAGRDACCPRSLAQYSALMVMEKEYGRDKMRRFLQLRAGPLPERPRRRTGARKCR